MKTILRKIGEFFKFIWGKLKTPYAKVAVAFLSLAVLGLSVLAIVLAIKKRPEETVEGNINLNRHKRDLEDKINVWQAYLDNNRPLHRR
jgi:hypothetical protein